MIENSSTESSATAHWLNVPRVRAYSAGLLITAVTYWVCIARLAWRMYGQPASLDFSTFWGASRLWREGRPLWAYSYEGLQHATKQISPTFPSPGLFSYPPNFLLLLKPVAYLPCSIASLLFVVVSAAIFVYLLHRVLPQREAWLPILAFPGIWLCIVQGQNACLTASLALGALVLLQKRQVLAGICVGILSIKPQLGVLFPLVLACTGMWRTFVTAAVTVLITNGIGVAVFGKEIIPLFLDGLHQASSAMASGALPWAQMASLFSVLRVAHVPVTAAYAAQACQAVATIVAVIWVWRRSRDIGLRSTALIAGTFMVSPYMYNYDGAWLGIAIVLFVRKALRDGWLRGEREVLCIAWVYPPLGVIVGAYLGAGFGPVVFWLMLGIAVRRVWIEEGARKPEIVVALERQRPSDERIANE